MQTVQTLLQLAVNLRSVSDTALLDTELLLAHSIGKNRTFLKTWPEYQLTCAEQAKFETLFTRRLQGEPIAYLLGEQGFWNLQLQVNSHTLIPRPETELLVERCLAYVAGRSQLSLLDLGTGTGAIALALAAEMPSWQIIGVDKIPEAVALADSNRQRHHINNAEFMVSDWFAALKGKRFDVIISNPPYIDAEDPHLQQGDVRYEPISALVAADNGLKAITDIIRQAATYLKKDGLLLFEHGYQQASDVINLLTLNGFSECRTYKDLAGHERVTQGVLR